MSHRKRPADAYPVPDSGAGDGPKRRGADAYPVADSGAGDGPRRRGSVASFPSYLDAPELPAKLRLICELLASAPSAAAVEPLLDGAAASIPSLSHSDVEHVLRLSYSHPGPALAFFRWSGARHLSHLHSPYSWNLLVDLLGKNLLFPPMWHALHSMHSLSLLSLATFASVFSSLASASASPPDAPLQAFLSLPSFGLPRDSAALNSLLSALCRAGRAADARAALPRAAAAAAGARPDADSFAILLEGCEADADPRAARQVLDEMLATLGWDPACAAAFDSFLVTLLGAGPSPAAGLADALQAFDAMRRNGCFPGMKFFRAAIRSCVAAHDPRAAAALWDALSSRPGCAPDTALYNSMISLQCSLGQAELAAALRYLDEMVFYGAFPDAETYDLLLHHLLRGRKLSEAAAIFMEMVRNEHCPSTGSCQSAVKIFLDAEDWETAEKVWRCMVENGLKPVEESGNMIVERLRGRGLLPEAWKFAEEVIDSGVKLYSSTLSKLRHSLTKVGKGSIHEYLLIKWKAH
ncbi:pentatricopeptide repeat-containing protein At1g71060, mitochondrial-like [Ananas comosus]|uniref:Pentatricopeptide repeat-containing protein At1g71060, mitochondrial-like n=1 Tax=Ananas comosus TaxID=4615 RepID=A0A199UGK3_ANACO|nr:pentatricopeptide repeat-containing protein At1g71060, mitochondrial-like [Ananas comosus]OAY63690.1 Pentatricopeptide repeat-containing protein, mitochondrial [Ananas comosus]